MQDVEGCSRTHMAPMHHVIIAKIAELAAKHVPICMYSGETSRHPSGIAMQRPCVATLMNTKDVHTVARWHNPPALIARTAMIAAIKPGTVVRSWVALPAVSVIWLKN